MDGNSVVTAHISDMTSHMCMSCFLCGGSTSIPAHYNTPAICNECRRKWNKLCKMVDVIEELTKDDNCN